MKRTTLLLSAAMMLCSATGAYGVTSATDTTPGGGKLSPYTQHFLRLDKMGLIDDNGMMRLPTQVENIMAKDANGNAATTAQRRLVTRMTNNGGTRMVESFIRLSPEGAVADIEAAGVEVANEIGDILVVRMPADQIEQVAALDAVQSIDISQPLRLLNNTTREFTRTDLVQQGGGSLEQPYTGKGVIVGIIDSGIEYNHINFMAADNPDSSRVVRAYVGSSNPYFPEEGTTYTTTEQISQLTTDTKSSTHGTHTTGTAAGSYSENGFQGMAPDADLYLSGLPSLTTSEIVSQADAIVSYAQEEGKPVVINLSVGSNNGPHMGSDETSVAFDRLAGEGAIFVIAAGNEGDVDLYLHKQFENATGEEQCRTILTLDEATYGFPVYYNYIDGYTDEPVQLKFLLIDTQNDNEVLYETELIGDGDWSLARSEAAAQFGTYFSIGDYGGDLMVYTDYDENIDKYVTEIMPYYMAVTNANRTGRYKLGFALYGTQGDEINMYTDSFTEFIDNDDPAYTAGTPDGSINEMATGREAISVGANVTKKTWKVFGKDGVASYPNDSEVIGNMATFSSYGYDMNGVWHPTIVAPGHVISSSLNRYNYGISYSDMTNTITSMVTSEDGNTSYYWGINSGTSMATPAVTGIIATWLQYDPTLTPDDIKDIFAHTAQKPETYGNVNPLQWGPNGIIDAYAGLAYMGAVGVNDVTKAQDMVLVYPNPTGGQFKVFAQGEEQVELSIYNMGGTKVYGHTYTTNDGNFDVDLQGSLPAGIYVLQLRGDRQNYSTKLVIN